MTALLKLMRPRQWIKNLVVLAGPALGQKLDVASAIDTGLIFVAFCLASSAAYVVNDLLDREADALHPDKRHRPLASGAVSPGAAVVLAVVLVAGAVCLAWLLLPVTCTVVLAGYFVLILAYSLALKQVLILDVVAIAIGFVLRAAAGAAAVEVIVSQWLLVCTFTLCLFLGFGKRRAELASFEDGGRASEHRRTLSAYTPELLNHFISVSAGIAVVTFLLYTMDRAPGTAPPFHKWHLLYSVPLVVYGIFRYAALVTRAGKDDPAEIILRDRPLLATIGAWSLFVALVIWEEQWLRVLGLERFFAH